MRTISRQLPLPRVIRASRLPFLLLLFVALTAVAQSEDFTYTTNNGAITIVGYAGAGGDVTIPLVITGLPVTSIDGSTFSASPDLASVTIPWSVTNVGTYIFLNCPSLTAIWVDPLSSSYRSVDGILYNREQTTLLKWPAGKAGSCAIPSGVTNIGWYAFSGCTGLTNVTIPSTVTTIGAYAFSTCPGLAGMTVPMSVTNIGNYAFHYCSNLAGITVEMLNPSYSSMDGVLFDESKATLLQYPPGRAGPYTIPDSAARIGSFAFSTCCNLTSVTIPSSVTNIGAYAFYACADLGAITVDTNNPNYSSLDGVLYDKSTTTLLQYPGGMPGAYRIPDGVMAIGNNAFHRCGRLTSVAMPATVTSMEDAAFQFCERLVAITVNTSNASFSSVGGILFNKSQTRLLQYPPGILGSYSIPDGVTAVGNMAFRFCTHLTAVTIPNSVITIGFLAFNGCNRLTTVTIPTNLSSMGSQVFYGCSSLVTLSIPDGVARIQASECSDCASLAAIDIPDSVMTIGDSAFQFCTNLVGAFFHGDAPRLDGPRVFFRAAQVIVYRLPEATGWGTTFAGRPTALWLPQLETSDASFGVRTNQFGFNIAWASGQTVVVEACTNLANPVWSPLRTNTLTADTLYFSDPAWTNHPGRFYRVRSP